VFGALAQMGGKLVRCMGIVRVTFALSLKGGELQPETAGVPEGRWAGTVRNDYGAPNRPQIAVRSLPRRFPPTALARSGPPPKFASNGLHASSYRQSGVIRGGLKCLETNVPCV